MHWSSNVPHFVWSFRGRSNLPHPVRAERTPRRSVPNQGSDILMLLYFSCSRYPFDRKNFIYSMENILFHGNAVFVHASATYSDNLSLIPVKLNFVSSEFRIATSKDLFSRKALFLQNAFLVSISFFRLWLSRAH